MQKKMVVLKSDLVGEDGPHTIGAIMIPVEKDLQEFNEEVIAVVNKVRQEIDEYIDDDILDAIEDLHPDYEITEPFDELVIRF